MSEKVCVYTRNPQNNDRFFLSCEFARIPTVGEYIWLVARDGDDPEICFKVVYVAHIPYVDGFSKEYCEYTARIYAVRESIDSIEELGFHTCG